MPELTSRLLRGVLDEEQGRRFDAFRSTVINKAVVKKVSAMEGWLEDKR